MADKEVRTEVVSVRLSAEEARRLKERAGDFSLSQFVRDLCIAAIAEKQPATSLVSPVVTSQNTGYVKNWVLVGAGRDLAVSTF